MELRPEGEDPEGRPPWESGAGDHFRGSMVKWKGTKKESI